MSYRNEKWISILRITPSDQDLFSQRKFKYQTLYFCSDDPSAPQMAPRGLTHRSSHFLRQMKLLLPLPALATCSNVLFRMKNPNDILRELSPVKEKERYRWDVYGLNAYCPLVKVTNWWYYKESLPKDFDAFNPTGSTIRSQYNRLGTCQENDSWWTTETTESMKRGLGDPTLTALIMKSQPHSMLTFLSYPRTLQPRKDLLNEEIRQILPSLPREMLKMRYSTTYNTCYKWGDMPQKK